jgi:adenine/guanine phosphoribosyltransferase-like PRPP-binding protein
LVEECGGVCIGFSGLIELSDLGGRRQLGELPVSTVLTM